MFNMEYYFSFYLFFLSCFMFSFYYKHMMLMVISLEFITINLVFNMFIIMMNLESLTYLMMYLLIFSVCEGVLVLSLIILIVRLSGNDYINSLSILKW